MEVNFIGEQNLSILQVCCSAAEPMAFTPPASLQRTHRREEPRVQTHQSLLCKVQLRMLGNEMSVFSLSVLHSAQTLKVRCCCEGGFLCPVTTATVGQIIHLLVKLESCRLVSVSRTASRVTVSDFGVDFSCHLPLIYTVSCLGLGLGRSVPSWQQR